MGPGSSGTGITDNVRESLSSIARAVAGGYGGAWIDKPRHKDTEALREWLRGQAEDVRRSFDRFHVIDLLEELRLHYWGNAAVELTPALPGLQVRRNYLKTVCRPRQEFFIDRWNRTEQLYRLASAEVTRTVAVEAVEPAYRLLYPHMAQGERDSIDRAIATGDAYGLSNATQRAADRLGSDAVAGMLAPQRPGTAAASGVGCDVLVTYGEKWVMTDEEYGPDNPVGGFHAGVGHIVGMPRAAPKPIRIPPWAHDGRISQLLARVVLGDLLDHDLRHDGAYVISE